MYRSSAGQCTGKNSFIPFLTKNSDPVVFFEYYMERFVGALHQSKLFHFLKCLVQAPPNGLQTHEGNIPEWVVSFGILELVVHSCYQTISMPTPEILSGF
jgi:hypothetical protein